MKFAVGLASDSTRTGGRDAFRTHYLHCLQFVVRAALRDRAKSRLRVEAPARYRLVAVELTRVASDILPLTTRCVGVGGTVGCDRREEQ